MVPNYWINIALQKAKKEGVDNLRVPQCNPSLIKFHVSSFSRLSLRYSFWNYLSVFISNRQFLIAWGIVLYHFHPDRSCIDIKRVSGTIVLVSWVIVRGSSSVYDRPIGIADMYDNLSVSLSLSPSFFFFFFFFFFLFSLLIKSTNV